jgi:hypothetical protein
MKLILKLVVPIVLLGTSCKKVNPPVLAKPEIQPTTRNNNNFAARPGTPQIKGNWIFAYSHGGLTGNMHMTAAEWGHTKKLNLKPDMTFKVTMDGTVTTGTYTLTSASIAYPPGIKYLITFTYPTVAGTYTLGDPIYQYWLTSDTLAMVPNNAADAMGDVYGRE